MTKLRSAALALLLTTAALPALAQTPDAGAAPPLELPPADPATLPDPLGADAPTATTPAPEPAVRSTTTTTRTTTDPEPAEDDSANNDAPARDAVEADEEETTTQRADDEGFDDWGLLGLLGLAGLLGLRRRDDRYAGTSTVRTTDNGGLR